MGELNRNLIIALVVVPVLLGILRTRTEMGLSIAAIGLALFFVNLDKFERFRTPGGFEAELRTAVNKAYAAIEQLKDLGLALSAPIVDDMSVSGRMLQYIPLKHKLERVENISATLKALGASQQEIEAATATIYARLADDHLNIVAGALESANPDKKAFLETARSQMEGWDRSKFEQFIAENALTKNDGVEQAILDLEYFREHKTLRRPELWQS